jgi:hypothetical protein
MAWKASEMKKWRDEEERKLEEAMVTRSRDMFSLFS